MNSRLELIQDLMPTVRTVVFDYLNQPKGTKADRNEAHDLAKALGYIETDIGTLESDADAIEFERFRLRPFFLQIHQVLQREHATLAKPVLGWSKINHDPNAIAFCGSPGTRDLLLKVCSERNLHLISVTTDWITAADRWDCLRSARVVVFDLSIRDKVLRASVFHELGLSIALGQYPVILIGKGDEVPFNVDIKPVELELAISDLNILGTALDKALFSFLRPSGRSSFQQTLEQLKRQIAVPTPEEMVLLKHLRSVNDSRIEALALVNQILVMRKHDSLAFFYPRWSGDYPDDKALCCFHITPFAEKFKLMRATVERSCAESGVEYRKGDQGPLMDILHSIWLLTCRADGVVADLTGLNDNVCVEVGIAFAIGRPILLTARKSEKATLELYPDIEKMQVRIYQNLDELDQLVTEFCSTLTM